MLRILWRDRDPRSVRLVEGWIWWSCPMLAVIASNSSVTVAQALVGMPVGEVELLAR
jgi:hypothetical protein